MPAYKVLVIDDDPEVRVLLGHELRDMGLQGVYAGDGVQALTIARRETPDLILLDIRLPGGDGLSILERLQRIPMLACIPVIVFTGLRTPELEERAYLLGARDFVSKSFSGSSLRAAIERVLDIPPTTPPGAPTQLPREPLRMIHSG